jgi:hypothetical protein
MAPIIREVESVIRARLWALFGESALALLWPLILPLFPSPRTTGGIRTRNQIRIALPITEHEPG